MKRNPILEVLNNPAKSFLANFVIGTLVFTIISDGISDLFWQWIETWAKAQPWISESLFDLYVRILLVILVLAIIYFTSITDWIVNWVKNRLVALGLRSEAKVTNVEPLNQTYPGLIVLMSSKPNDSPAEAAIRYHLQKRDGKSALKYCWIICTNRTWEFARQMVDRLKQSGGEQVRFYYGTDPIEDAENSDEVLSLLIPDEKVDDPNHVRKLVEGIYAIAHSKSLNETELIADYTGGTKGMTAGLLLACTKPERSLQYISQVNYPQIMSVQIAYQLKQRKPTESARRLQGASVER